ncbi:MAG: GNAT family N-acetyltransferase [Acidimicrobiales bacterium]
MDIEVQRVEASRTYPLRQAVLRPHQSVEQMALDGDDDPDSAHFAALCDGQVVTTASVRPEAPPWEPDHPLSWRLRGMATTGEHRNQGIGGRVLGAVVKHVQQGGGGLLWCNARLPALPFYRRAGFVARGEAWVDPTIGPHIAMEMAVPAYDAATVTE